MDSNRSRDKGVFNLEHSALTLLLIAFSVKLGEKILDAAIRYRGILLMENFC
jgi:hypothetical protein